MTTVRQQGRGRPSKDIDRAVADAVIDRISSGLGDLSVEAIARVVGVHRSTIYRRWSTRSALIETAMGRIAELLSARAISGHPSYRELLDAACELLATPSGRRLTVARASTSAHVGAGDGREKRLPVPTAVHDLIVGAVMHRVLIAALPTTEEWKGEILSILGGRLPRTAMPAER